MKYELTALLAILQQAEYDHGVFWRWVKTKRSSEETARLNTTQPERWTPKLKLVRSLAGVLQPLVGAARAVTWSSRLTSLPQQILANFIIWRAARRIRFLQERGLTVVAIAGSYGKTTTKLHLRHVLSNYHHTLVTPDSINTPLGIAATIQSSLTTKHTLFIVELGEQKRGDLDTLMSFVQPDIAVITPIGFAHGQHFGSAEKILAAFSEMTESRYRPALFLIDDANKGQFDPKGEAIWYGTDLNSTYRLTELASDLNRTSAQLHTQGKKYEVSTPLWGKHQLTSFLPGLALLAGDRSVEDVLNTLQYAPPIHRRLEVHTNPNGTVVIDNSYNTNPGSWQEMKPLIQSLSPKKVIVITAGFVELDKKTVEIEHEKLGKELPEVSVGTIILRTIDNHDLRQLLSKREEKSFKYTEADSLDEALSILEKEQWRFDILWLEGGCRELYQ